MTPQQRIDFAREFILAQKTVEACVDHEQIKHQLKCVGITLVKGDGTCWAYHDGDRVKVRSINDLIRYIS
jgi:hypothetical protein